MRTTVRLWLWLLAVAALVLGVVLFLRAFVLSYGQGQTVLGSEGLPQNPALAVLGVNTEIQSTSSSWGQELSTSTPIVPANSVLILRANVAAKTLMAMSPQIKMIASVPIDSLDVRLYGERAYTYVLPSSFARSAQIWGQDGKELSLLFSAAEHVDLTGAMFAPVTKDLFWVEVDRDGRSSISFRSARGTNSTIRSRVNSQIQLLSLSSDNSILYWKQGSTCWQFVLSTSAAQEINCMFVPIPGQRFNYRHTFADVTKFIPGTGDQWWRADPNTQTEEVIASLANNQLYVQVTGGDSGRAAFMQDYVLTPSGQIVLNMPRVVVNNGVEEYSIVGLPAGTFESLRLDSSARVWVLMRVGDNQQLLLWDNSLETKAWQTIAVPDCISDCSLTLYP